jgi:hypothetical protein
MTNQMNKPAFKYLRFHKNLSLLNDFNMKLRSFQQMEEYKVAAKEQRLP